jgi:phosphatidate cytidylyltransferase
LASAAAVLADGQALKSKKNMLAKRAASAAVMLVVAFTLVFLGGWIFTLGVSLVLAVAAWEYGRMFVKGGYYPSLPILVVTNFLLAVSSSFQSGVYFLAVFAFSSLIAIAYQVFQYPRHPETSAVDLAAMLSGLIFIGFMGSYLLRLRLLPNGSFWLILAVLPAGISDVGAFITGSLFGSRKLAPELSPHKTVEGYLGGLLTSAVIGYLAGAVSAIYNPEFTGSMGLLLGIVTGIFCPLGDLGKSLFKRQFNLKNTSNLIPGHGGVLDRVDTWLWAGVIGYYSIIFYFI